MNASELLSASSLSNSFPTADRTYVESLNAPLTNDTNTTETSTSDNMLSQAIFSPAPILPYVNFSEYYANVERARQEGTLPEGIEF